MTAFFMTYKEQFDTLEDAMGWIISHAGRYGMTGPEAERRGYAQIFWN